MGLGAGLSSKSRSWMRPWNCTSTFKFSSAVPFSPQSSVCQAIGSQTDNVDYYLFLKDESFTLKQERIESYACSGPFTMINCEVSEFLRVTTFQICRCHLSELWRTHKDVCVCVCVWWRPENMTIGEALIKNIKIEFSWDLWKNCHFVPHFPELDHLQNTFLEMCFVF